MDQDQDDTEMPPFSQDQDQVQPDSSSSQPVTTPTSTTLPTPVSAQLQSTMQDIFGGDSDSDDLEEELRMEDGTLPSSNNKEGGDHRALYLDFDSDEEVNLPSFKKKTVVGDGDYGSASETEEEEGEGGEDYEGGGKKKKAKKGALGRQKSRKSLPKKDSTLSSRLPEREKGEAEKDIDAILQRLKPARSQKIGRSSGPKEKGPSGEGEGSGGASAGGVDLNEEVRIDTIISEMVENMRKAAKEDQDLSKEGNPATAKLKLLPSISLHLSKAAWHASLLDANVLQSIRYWLEPLDDGSLPSLDIQQNMLGILANLPVETHHLRSSQIGRLLMFYTKCPRISTSIKRASEDLVRRWMRPILGKSAEYKHRKVREVRVNLGDGVKVGGGGGVVKKTHRRPWVQAEPSAFERANRASIPQKIQPNFSVVPVSNLGPSKSSNGGGHRDDTLGMERAERGEKKVDRFKKLKSVLRK